MPFEADNLLKYAVENSPDAFYLSTTDGRIVHVNQSACTALGYTYAELTAMRTSDIDPGEVIQADGTTRIDGVALSGKRGVFESRHRRKDGTIFPVEVTYSNLSVDGREYSYAFARDIYTRKDTERQREELRFIVDHASDAVYIYDRDGGFRYVNDSACRATGYSREELLKLSVFDIAPDLTRESFTQTWDRRRLEGSATVESVHRDRNGKLLPVEITVNTLSIEGRIYSCAFVRDISERKAALQRLEMLQFAIDNSSVPIYFYDDRANITYANKSVSMALGYTQDELTCMTVFDVDPNVTPEIWGALYANVKAGKVGMIPSTNRRKDGTIFPVEVTPTNMIFGDQEFGCSVNLDVSARVAAEKALRESEEKFRVIAETSPVALIIHRTADGAIMFANRAAEILFHRSGASMVGSPVMTLIENEESRQAYSDIMTGKETVQGRELMLDSKDGKTRWASLSASAISLNDEQAVCCVLQDVTEAHDLSLQLSYQAAYDPLTGLVNRREFESRLSRVIKSVGVNGAEHALCFLDLDQFKVINDTCGHIAGDELLRQLGQILKSHIRKSDTLARLGGDEFAALLENCSLSEGRRVANAIREAVQQYRFLWENKSFSVGVSIGLVPIDRPDEDLTEVMRRADTACYQAKENGRNRVHVYHADDAELAQRHGEMQWVSRITSALEQDRLQIWAQKIVSIRNPNDRRVHYELLVRMVDEAGHIVPPGAFLPAAERYNLITRIDRWVIDHTLHWFSRHPDEYEKLKMCSINLSGQSLCNEDLCREIIEYFHAYQLTAEKFCFEITETSAIANLNAATRFMLELRKLGCRFALDDFGSGLSSFAYLKNIPVDFLKIDGLFIRDLETDPIHLALVKSINEVGHVMGKETIAEFVENARILEKLRDLGVDYAQGYGVAKPELLIAGTNAETMAN